MGLDVGRASWSYSGFNRFCTRLASMIGLTLDRMVGFGGDQQWPDPKEEPIVFLLDHSDCDGDLTPDQCHRIAPRLREMVAAWPDDYDKEHAILLADSMDEAAATKKLLVFH